MKPITSLFNRRLWHKIPNRRQVFHRRYRGFIGSQDYLVTTIRPALTWSYYELAGMSSFLASHTWRRLNAFCNISVTLGMSLSLALVAPGNQMSSGDGSTQSGPAILILAALTLATSLWWTSDLLLEELMSRQRLFVYFQSRTRYCEPGRARGSLSSSNPQRFRLPTTHCHGNLWVTYNVACVAVGENPVRRQFSPTLISAAILCVS